MNYEEEDVLDIDAIQEQNLEKLQSEIFDAAQSTVMPEEEDESIENSALVENELEEKLEEVLQENEPVHDVLLKDINKSVIQKVMGFLNFVMKYILTASFIFVVLMAFTNYSAYITIAKSYLNPDAIIESEKNIQKSLEESLISSKRQDGKGETKRDHESEIYKTSDLRNILGNVRSEEIQLDIEIIPFVNRIVIPKIGKNIPLVDIAKGQVEGLHELNDIFMNELEGGVVRYPGSARPGEYGNSFIFGHSSNFPWVAGDYNDVFALLDRLEIGDEVVTYYEGKKYVYKIQEKKVISPNDVSVLKRDTGKKEITLMTCWPIGTTYNRLLVIGELVK